VARRGINIGLPVFCIPRAALSPYGAGHSEAYFNLLISHYYDSDYDVPSHQIMVQPSIAIFATFIQLALFAQLSIGFPVQYVVLSSRNATLFEISLLLLGLWLY